MLVGAYWSRRKESKEVAADRIAAFLKAVGVWYEDLATWYVKARSRSTACKSPLIIESGAIADRLKCIRRDDNGLVISELGFELSLWNGGEASFAVSIGSFSHNVRNSAVLDIMMDEKMGREVSRTLLNEIVSAFEPEHAVATSDEILARSESNMPWEFGWFTYKRGVGIREH